MFNLSNEHNFEFLKAVQPLNYLSFVVLYIRLIREYNSSFSHPLHMYIQEY